MSQAVDTDRIKVDDHCWRVQCAECGEWFEATRSDASFCKPAHRKRWHERPVRFQNAMLELRSIQRRVKAIADQYKGSQTAYDEMVNTAKAVDSAISLFETKWEQKSF